LGTITKVYTFFPKVTADASEVNRNFDDLFTLVNGNLNSANILSTYSIGASNVTINDTAAQFSSCHVEHALYELKVLFAALSGATVTEFSEGLIGNVGSASQQYAGHIWTLTEPNTTATQVIALYSFCAASLYQDVCNTFNFTPGSNAPIAASGIMGLDNAIYFSGATGAYLYQGGALLDASMSAMCIDFWMAPQDGQNLSAATIFSKWNTTANATMNRMRSYLSTEGKLYVEYYANGSGNELNSNYIFANGTCSYAYVCITQDTANGIRLFINGCLDAFNSSQTQGMAAGAASDLYIGATYGSATNTITGPYYGHLSQFRVRNKYITQQDVDIAFATKYAKPASPAGNEVNVRAQVLPTGNSENIRTYQWDNVEVLRNSTHFYRMGGVATDLSATDRLKIFVRS
jgi:hypothetical protein